MNRRLRMLPVDRVAIGWYAMILALAAANARALAEPGAVLGFFAFALAVFLAIPWFAARITEGAALALRTVAAYVLIPVTFDMVGRVVPQLSPDSRETWLRAADRILFGSDPTRWTGDAERFPALTEVLQWIYTSFYLLPLVLAVRLALRRNARAIEQALLVLVAGFLVSYLGYFLVPARSPYRLFSYPFEFRGVLATEELRGLIRFAEQKRHDVFPSGHSDVTWLVAALAWRHDRRSFWWFFGPVAVLLPIGTVYLRYHYAVDVIAAAAFSIFTWRLCMALERAAGRPDA